MILEHYNPELIIADDAYAWRYMSFEKIWDILSNDKIYFSRLDSFDDPLEGMPIKYIKAIYYANIRKFDSEYIQEKMPTRFEINGWQHGVFASCWYLTEGEKGKLSNHEESFAMWNLYSNAEGFCLKIKFSELKKIIENALIDFSDLEIFQAFFGRVEYLGYFDDFFTLDKTKTNIDILRSSIKHASYKHENEVRFLLLANNKELDRSGIEFKLKQRFIEVNPAIQIICHPDMDNQVFLTFKNKFEQIGISIQQSKLLTAKVISRFIK